MEYSRISFTNGKAKICLWITNDKYLASVYLIRKPILSYFGFEKDTEHVSDKMVL